MKKGDRVVCVTNYSQFVNNITKKGHYYTVIGVVCDGDGLLLAEVVNEGVDWYGHLTVKFRKVEDKPFTNALTKSLAEEACKETVEVEEFELI